MTINQRVSLWRVALVVVALLKASAVFGQTCNPNTASSFTSWSGNGDTVTDTATGLIWQRCAYGQGWNGSTCGGTAFTAAWAAAVTGAPSGWRLPNVKELESIVERQCAAPAMNTAAFPAAPSVNFWSSTPGWAVSFNDGSVLSGQAAGAGMAVRYVQGGNSFAAFDAGPGAATNCSPNVPQDRTAAQLVVNADDTVTDQTTGLTWRRCAEGMTYAGGRCSSVSTYNTYSWQQALAVPAQSGNAGWRVPNVKELESLVDRSCANPAVSGGRFPDQPAVDFWSSTPGWAVSFNDGSVLSGQTYSAAKAVRLVKDGASAAASTTGAGGAGLCTTQAPSDFRLTNWVENADSTLFDSGTGLTWERCVRGQTWSAAVGACTGLPVELSWSNAVLQANVAMYRGRADWRVPNVKELESIVDRRCSSPALNPDLFRGNQETMTWSSTPGWALNMADGSVLSGQAASTTMAVRWVRGGSKSAGFDARFGTVPGAVVAGPDLRNTDIVNPSFLLPSNPGQKLMFITHGWRSSTGDSQSLVDTMNWPLVMLKQACARLLATPSYTGAVSRSQLGVTGACETPQWRVVAFNWAPLAYGGLDRLPHFAYGEAAHLGELVGKEIVKASTKYSFVHLIAHSAGSKLVHEMARVLRLDGVSTPKIHTTFLDAFCPNPSNCDYGSNSDWAEQYFDDHPVIYGENRDTATTLCNAANFNLSNTYLETPSSNPLVLWAARHGWPYQCYVDSASTGAVSDPGFNVACLGKAAGNVGYGLSYVGSGATDVLGFINGRRLSYPKGSLQTQSVLFTFSVQQQACNSSAFAAAVAGVSATVGSAISWINTVVGAGVPSPTSTCASPAFMPPSNAGSTPVTLGTCLTSTIKSAPGLKAADSENLAAWSALTVATGRRTNQLRFSLQFTAPADGVLTVYVDEQQVYRTTHAVRGDGVYDTGFFDVPAMERGAHTVSFRLDALEMAQAAVVVSALQVGAVALCDLDVDGDGAMTVARDGALLLRYLMGFRGEALTAGLGISDLNAAQAITDYVGSAVQFDVFGRSSSAPLATTDGLVLLRLMLGMSDDALLSGIAVPSGALFATSSAVRSNVNGKCGTRF